MYEKFLRKEPNVLCEYEGFSVLILDVLPTFLLYVLLCVVF